MIVIEGISQREECIIKFKEYTEAEGLQIDIEKELYTAEELVHSSINATHGRHLTLIVDAKGRNKKGVTCKFGEQCYKWEIETSDRERRNFIKRALEYVPEHQIERDLDMVESGLMSQIFHRDDNIIYGIANKGNGDICAFTSGLKGRVNDFDNSNIYVWKTYRKG